MVHMHNKLYKYYKGKLSESKGNMKGTWSILNQVKRPNAQHNKLAVYLVEDEPVLNNRAHIENGFNSFFFC